MLKNEWTEAWEGAESPGYLPMPLQGMVTMDMITRTHRYADKAQKVAFNPVGQVVGMINESRSVRSVIQDLVAEYVSSVERLQSLMPD
jgi:NAD(P)H-dependent flavin oxidoreductase YrpB (nitropropane dioxygenase family)